MEVDEAKYMLACLDNMNRLREEKNLYAIWEKGLKDEIFNQLKKRERQMSSSHPKNPNTTTI